MTKMTQTGAVLLKIYSHVQNLAAKGPLGLLRSMYSSFIGTALILGCPQLSAESVQVHHAVV